jgi:uncharacterized membrane protein
VNESVLLFSVITTLLYAVGTVGFLIYVIRTEKVIHRIAYGEPITSDARNHLAPNFFAVRLGHCG